MVTTSRPRQRRIASAFLAAAMAATVLGAAAPASAGSGVKSWDKFGECRYPLVIAYVNHDQSTTTPGFEADLETLCGDLRPNPS